MSCQIFRLSSHKLFNIKFIILVTSFTVELISSRLVWAGCDIVGSPPGYYYYVCAETSAEFHGPEPLTECQASCIPSYTLTLKTNGTGSGKVSGEGTYQEGSAITLKAEPNADSQFVGWQPQDQCFDGMTLKANLTCTATFDLKSTTQEGPPPSPMTTPQNMNLWLQVAGSGSGKVNGGGAICRKDDCSTNAKGELVCNTNCTRLVPTGSAVILTHEADSDSVFSSWGGNADCAKEQFTLDQSKKCVAYFHRLYKLTVTLQGPGQVTGSDSEINCGTQCQVSYESKVKTSLQATPAAGQNFLGWSGDCQGTQNPLTVEATQDLTCTAQFGLPTPATPPGTVTKQNQKITQFSPPTTAVRTETLSLTAIGGGSGNPVTFASTSPTVCAVSGSTVTLMATGTCTLTADQAGNDAYHAASTVTANVQVNPPLVKQNQVITNFSPASYASVVNTAVVNGQAILTATGGASGNPVTYTSATPTICTVTGHVVKLLAVGLCKINADQAGNDQYYPASQVVAEIQVNPAVESPQPSPSTTVEVLKPATDLSPPPVTAPISYPVPVCPNITEKNGVLIVHGLCSAQGWVFDKAVVVESGGSLSKATFNNTVDNQGLVSNVTIGKGGTLTGGVVSGTVNNQGTMCDIDFIGDSFTGDGTLCRKINNQSKVGACIDLQNFKVLAGTTITGCAEKKDQRINVSDETGTPGTTTSSSIVTPASSKKEQTITFDKTTPITSKVGATHLLYATASSGLVVTFTSATPTTCNMSQPNAVALLAAGTCTIMASQAGNESYHAAKSVNFNITVEKADQTIAFLPEIIPSALSKREQTITFDKTTPITSKMGATQLLYATASSGLVVTFTSATPTTCTLSRPNLVEFVTAGTCMIMASQTGNESYHAAQPVNVQITVENLSLWISEVEILFRNLMAIQSSLRPTKYMWGVKRAILKAISKAMYKKHRGKKDARSKPPAVNGNNLAFLNTLGDSLEAAGYRRNDLVVGDDGSLFVAKDAHGLLAQTGDTTVYIGPQAPGLYTPEEGLPYLVFADTDDQLKQTTFYPMLSPLIAKALSQEMPTMSVESALDGTIKLTLENGIFSFWQASYVVTAGNEALEMNKVGDNLVISAGGHSQELTPGIPTFDESGLEFLKILLKGVEKLGFDPNNLMLTGFGSFVIADANGKVIVSFQAGAPEIDTGTQPADLYVPTGATPYVLFVDVDNQLKRSTLAPAVSPDILATIFDAFPNATLTLEPTGPVTVSFDGEPATTWQPAYVITAGPEPFEKAIIDGQLILSGGGQRQQLSPIE